MSGPVVPWAYDADAVAVLHSQRPRSRLTVLSVAILGLALVLVVLLLLMVGGPRPVLISALAAAVSFPLLIWFFFWLDRWEPEPARYRWAALAWAAPWRC